LSRGEQSKETLSFLGCPNVRVIVINHICDLICLFV
jgi:hypothetical protein